MIGPDRLLHKLPSRVQTVFVMTGGFLVYAAICGLILTVGNVSPYAISYLKSNVKDQSDPGYNLIIWLPTVSDLCTAVSAVLGGILEKRLGPRCATAIAMAIVTIGAGTSYYTIQKSFWLWVFTYGALPGVGFGIACTTLYVCRNKWLPNNKGLATGAMALGSGVGQFIFNFVETTYVNPWNFAPNSDGYFTQQLLLNRIPMLFGVLAGLSLVIGLIACFLLIDPKLKIDSHDEPNSSTPLLHARNEQVTVATGQRLSDNSLPPDPSVKEVLRSGTFWCLWLTAFFVDQTAFGQTFISNDALLAGAGSTSALTCAIGLIVFGHLGDKFSYQSIMAIITCVFTAFMATLCVTQYVGHAVYFIWVCVIFFIQAGLAPLFPIAIATSFGERNAGVNYGLVLTSMAVGSPLTALLTTFLLNRWGYCGMFLVVSLFVFFAFCTTLVIHWTRHGTRIGMRKCKRRQNVIM